MSWHTGVFANTNAGNLITVLDAHLTENACWTIYDAAVAANVKCYRCYENGANCDFYMKVDDSNVGYAIIELWEGWDAVGHSGTGASLTTIAASAMRLNRPVGAWMMAVHDHNFIYITSAYRASYIGQPRRYDTSKNIVLFIGNLSAAVGYNPLGSPIAVGTDVGLGTLFDEAGNKILLTQWGPTTAIYFYMKTIGGTFIVYETPIINSTTTLVMGQLEGWMRMHETALNGLVNDDVVTVDGVDWIGIFGGTSGRGGLIKEG